MISFLKSCARIAKNTVLTIILSCIVIFMVNNREVIKLKFFPLPFEVETRIFVIMISFFLAGLAFGMIICGTSLIKKSIIGVKNRAEIRKLENKLQENKDL